MELRHVIHPFPPVVDSNCRLLILGSVPSVKSVENNFYYMHPQNRFWKLMSRLFNDDFVCADSLKKSKLLLKNHIALYDSVEECDIGGSSDNRIFNVIPADIGAIIAGTQISKILCNGAASFKFLTKYHPEFAEISFLMPSTSPANASFSLDELEAFWRAEIFKN